MSMSENILPQQKTTKLIVVTAFDRARAVTFNLSLGQPSSRPKTGQ